MVSEKSHSEPLLGSQRISLDSDQPWLLPLQKPHSRSKLHALSWLLQLVLFSVSAFLFAHSRPAARCVDRFYVDSPATVALSDELVTRRFNASFFTESPYTSGYTLEADKLWHEIMEGAAISIDEETRRAIGAPDDSVTLPPESGGGYMAMYEFHHQLHCVNQLWKASYPEAMEQEKKDWPDDWRQHLNHCADVLRQMIQCQPDVGIITFNWVSYLDLPSPNFNNYRKCQDWDRLVEWVEGTYAAQPHGGLKKRPGIDMIRDTVP